MSTVLHVSTNGNEILPIGIIFKYKYMLHDLGSGGSGGEVNSVS